MKIAILSDIHGNHYALKAVLDACKKEGVEQLFVLGDLVGYYYNPANVLELLADWPHHLIKGNHEVILQDLSLGKLDATALRLKYGSGHQIALQQLTEAQQNYLYNLPEQLDISTNGVNFQLNHGTPWSIDTYLYPDASSENINRCHSVNHDFVLIGHSHYAFCHRGEKSTLINSGSVGQSRQKGGLANWTLVHLPGK
ncbi:MAG: hypothetical protein RLY16_2564, partial [Bacteroidota bacterium]